MNASKTAPWRLIKGLSLVALLGLGACTTMSKEECSVARWDDVGYRDGLAGRSMGRLDALSKACAEAGVRVDAQAYVRGRDAGLQSYCQIPNATKLGLEGRIYEGVCPPFIDPEFRMRYQLGRDVFLAQQNLAGAEARRRALERALADAKTDADRRRARDELSQHDYMLARARDQLRNAEYNFQRYR